MTKWYDKNKNKNKNPNALNPLALLLSIKCHNKNHASQLCSLDWQVPTSPLENKNKSNVWTHFQEQEVSVDYTPSGANPDPGMPPPIGA